MTRDGMAIRMHHAKVVLTYSTDLFSTNASIVRDLARPLPMLALMPTS
jgi:hypothetical protein